MRILVPRYTARSVQWESYWVNIDGRHLALCGANHGPCSAYLVVPFLCDSTVNSSPGRDKQTSRHADGCASRLGRSFVEAGLRRVAPASVREGASRFGKLARRLPRGCAAIQVRRARENGRAFALPFSLTGGFATYRGCQRVGSRFSLRQVELHPSLFRVLPSSHVSPASVWSIPSPQRAPTRQPGKHSP